MDQRIFSHGCLLPLLAERFVLEGFSQSYEHFNGVYEALKDDVGRIVQLYEQIGDMDKGFEERRHGFNEQRKPVLYAIAL